MFEYQPGQLTPKANFVSDFNDQIKITKKRFIPEKPKELKVRGKWAASRTRSGKNLIEEAQRLNWEQHLREQKKDKVESNAEKNKVN